MEFFAVMGSGKAIGRTTLSLVLAHGFLRRGLRPLFVQVLREGELPALVPDASSILSHTFQLEELGAEAIGLMDRVMSLGAFAAAIVDLPAETFPKCLLEAPGSHVLLPLSSQQAKLRYFLRDFASISAMPAIPSGRSVVVVPVGWPVVMRPCDFEPLLEREAARERHQVSPRARQIQSLGVTDSALAHLPPIVDGRINPDPLFEELAVQLARQTLCQSGSELIDRDPIWGICQP